MQRIELYCGFLAIFHCPLYFTSCILCPYMVVSSVFLKNIGKCPDLSKNLLVTLILLESSLQDSGSCICEQLALVSQVLTHDPSCDSLIHRPSSDPESSGRELGVISVFWGGETRPIRNKCILRTLHISAERGGRGV